MEDFEKSLNDMFVKKAPALPEGGKKFIVQYLPWINLIVGAFTLWTVYWLWHWAHWANQLAGYVNSLSSYYGGPTVPIDRMTPMLWLSLIVLAVEAVIYILAFPATLARQKRGWNLLFYALIVNIVYGFLVMFTSYGGFGSFIGTLIGSAIGLYFLFQIRASYTGEKARGVAPKEKS
jgi:hypothetical protein